MTTGPERGTIREPYIAFATAFLYLWTMLAFRG